MFIRNCNLLLCKCVINSIIKMQQHQQQQKVADTKLTTTPIKTFIVPINQQCPTIQSHFIAEITIVTNKSEMWFI